MPVVAAGAAFPFFNSPEGKAWDQIVFDGEVYGGATTPGRAEVDFDFNADVAAHRTRGRHGARLVDQGLKPAQIKIKLFAWRAEHFAALEALVQHKFQPWKVVAERRVLEVLHPALRVAGLTLLKPLAIGALKPSGRPGMFAMDLSLVQYTPPAKRQQGVTATQTATIDPTAVFDPNGRGALNRVTPRDTETGPRHNLVESTVPNAPPS